MPGRQENDAVDPAVAAAPGALQRRGLQGAGRICFWQGGSLWTGTGQGLTE